MRKHHFIERNRLISGMCHSLLIPQAARRSGSMITAHIGMELGRPLFVVPGHPLIPAYGGNLELGELGATFVSGSKDLEQFIHFECKDFFLNKSRSSSTR